MCRSTIEGGSAAESSDPPARHLGILDRSARPADNDLACIALVTFEIVKLSEFGERAIENHRARTNLVGQRLSDKEDRLQERTLAAAVCPSKDSQGSDLEFSFLSDRFKVEYLPFRNHASPPVRVSALPYHMMSLESSWRTVSGIFRATAIIVA